ncbi:MAG: archease [Rhodomicrobium sp.]
MTAAQPELAAYRAEHDVSKATHFPHGADALIFEMATRNMVFGDYRVDIDGSQLHGIAKGEAISIERHNPAVEIKGATLTELAVVEDGPTEWCAQCVVDV